jgi:hypothetical protein
MPSNQAILSDLVTNLTSGRPGAVRFCVPMLRLAMHRLGYFSAGEYKKTSWHGVQVDNKAKSVTFTYDGDDGKIHNMTVHVNGTVERS